MSTTKDPQQKKAPVIQINQEVLHDNLSGYVRKNLENVLNELLDAEADRLCHAKRYERNAERASTRAGSYKRKIETTSGKVTLNIPKLRNLPFETAIIERYRRRESSIEEAMMEMYLAGVSVRRIEDITEALWGARVSAGTISNLNKKIYGDIEEWRKVNFHSKCKILGGVAEFFSKAVLCRFPPEYFPRPVVYPVHSLC